MKYRVMKVVDFEYDTEISAIHTDTPKAQPLRGVYCKQHKKWSNTRNIG